MNPETIIKDAEERGYISWDDVRQFIANDAGFLQRLADHLNLAGPSDTKQMVIQNLVQADDVRAVLQ